MQSRKRRKKKETSLRHILLMIGIALSLLSGAVTLQSDKLNLQRIIMTSFILCTRSIVCSKKKKNKQKKTHDNIFIMSRKLQIILSNLSI